MDHTITITLPEPTWGNIRIAYGICHLLFAIIIHAKLVLAYKKVAKQTGEKIPHNVGEELALKICISYIFGLPAAIAILILHIFNHTIGRAIVVWMFWEFKPLLNFKIPNYLNFKIFNSRIIIEYIVFFIVGLSICGLYGSLIVYAASIIR